MTNDMMLVGLASNVVSAGGCTNWAISLTVPVSLLAEKTCWSFVSGFRAGAEVAILLSVLSAGVGSVKASLRRADRGGGRR